MAANCASAQPQADCHPIAVINNGVCRDETGNDCSKDAIERGSQLCVAPDPQYTSVAEKAQIRGTVVLSHSVSTQGCAENIRVVRGLGYGLDDAAIYALERFRWQKRTKPINYVETEFNFDPQYHSTKASTNSKCSEGNPVLPGQRR
jgi:TonB family protein